MKGALIHTIFITLLTFITNTAFADTELLLRLKFISDDQVTKTISFYGDHIDPNISYHNEQFKIKIDDTDIYDIKFATLHRLNHLRRQFSYDFQSGGIDQSDSSNGIACRLGGSSSGILLEVRYVTYNDSVIVSDEMLPVYDLPLNCLYNPHFKPKSSDAKQAARGAVETLRTIGELKSY